jgi:NTE family protein
VGAARLGTAKMCYFDSRDMPLSVEHILASGALPPAFPPILIDGHYYWDGGILSNTPIEAVFDDRERKSGLVFAVHVWNAHGPDPRTLWEVLNRQKDIQYSSRAASHIARQQQIHKLRHIIRELAAHLPQEKRNDPEVADLISYGCLTYMHVILLQAPPLPDDNHLKDIDFSERSICRRWELGYEHTKRAIKEMPWRAAPAAHEGVVIHNSVPG